MAQRMTIPRGKRVSPEMDEVLNRVAGVLTARRRADARRLLAGSAFEDLYIRCTWWGGCYYCQDVQGRWHLIKCYA